MNVFSSAVATDSLEKETGAGKDEVEPAPKKVHEEPTKTTQVLGILPGIGDYGSSSNSENDSDSSVSEGEIESLPSSIFNRKNNKNNSLFSS